MKKIALLMLVLLVAAGLPAKEYQLKSPDRAIVVTVNSGEQISYSVERAGIRLLDPSHISLMLLDGTRFGGNDRFRVSRRSVDNTVPAKNFKRASVRDHFNELTLSTDNYDIVFRAYDDGVAYRFVDRGRNGEFAVAYEQAEFAFAYDSFAYVPYVTKDPVTLENQFFNSFENTYAHHALSQWEKGRLAFLPLVVEGANGIKLCITEADLWDYPGMYLSNQDGSRSLRGVFASCPDMVEQGGHNMLQGLVQSREDYLAQVAADEAFPWRIVLVSGEDKDLLTCDIPWLLGRDPAAGEDFSWVKPGKVAWDWWNDWNVYGVNFESGVNNDTYKYYIDFAANNGIEYVILDEGWAVNKQADLFQVIPEIDLPMLCQYAQKKGVGLILWAGYWAFDKDLERACREYAAMGVKGFKVDFMDRDDQPMMQFYRRAAETAARYHLLLDFHGACKPTGLQRSFPNVVNFEGVYGLENAKGLNDFDIDLVSYEVSIPFVRLVSGPADYTQGAMRNATRDNFRYVYTEAMSQGTRCRQLAEYVIFDAPLTMLCDAPSNYLKEPACLQFIAKVPTVWDETVALEGKAGEYVAMARRKGDTWYVGAITDWNAREMTLDLSFIGGKPLMEIFRDGVNAHRAARDFKQEWMDFPADGKVQVKMAPGGGWAAVIRQEPEPWQLTDKDWPRFDYYEKQNAALTVRPKAVLFGDSITRNWAGLDQAWLDEHHFVGRGISGQTTMQMLPRFRSDVIELHPEYAVILAGANDIARNNGYISVEHIFGNLVSMVELARANGIKPVMCTLCPAREIGWHRRVGDPRPQIAQLNELIKAYAAEQGIPLVDYHSVMRGPDDGMDPRYERDAVHPNLAGYKVMEKALLEVLSQPMQVMSFNVRNASAKDGDNCWENRRDAAVAMLNTINPVVVGLQEALPEQEAYLTAGCPQYLSYGVGRNDGVNGERMSILYHREILEFVDGGTWWLSETPDVPSVGWDAKYPRTATWALLRFRRGGQAFYFVNTHLDHKGVEARKNGLAMVVRKIREMNPDIPMVLTGDFNVEPGDPALTALDGLMLDARTTAPESVSTPSFNGYKPQPQKIIDYIYYSGFSGAASFRVVTESYLGVPFISDHYPIVSTLSF